MLSLTPTPVELVSYSNDGKDTRHYSFRLLNPDAMVTPEPGQFFMLYIPGHGSAPFTFTTTPDEKGKFSVLIRCVGDVTTALFACNTGDILGARGPFGKGWPLASLARQRILMVSGGCGLAPLAGLVDHLIDTTIHKELVLLNGAKNHAAQVLNPERKRWRQHISIFDVLDESSENALQGTPLDIMDTVLSDFSHPPTLLLLCGPERMMNAVAKNFVDQRGFNPASIWLSIERRMHCAVGLCGHCYLEHSYVCTDGPTYRWDRLQELTNHQTKALTIV